MITASTGQFSYSIDSYEFGHAKTAFAWHLDEMTDRGFRAFIHQKELNLHSKALTKAARLSTTFEDAIDEAISVLNEERQAAVYSLLSELLDAAYATGACQVLAGLDPAVRELAARRTKRAREARTSPDREAAIEAAIVSHGPKIVNIQRKLRQAGIELGDDAIRRRKSAASRQTRIKDDASE